MSHDCCVALPPSAMGLSAVCVFLVSHDCCVALPPSAMGLSAVCDSDISWSYSLTISECIG